MGKVISVYKYMNIKYAIDSLKNGIFAGSPRHFNDPYEEKNIRYIDQFRICCMSSSYNKMLMWAHYGNHQQCCIGFSVEDSVIVPVEYTEHYHLTRQHIENASIEMFYYKAKEWAYETEKRAVCDTRNYDETIWKKIGERYYLRAVPKKIFFGLRANLETKEVQELFKYVKEHNLSNKDRVIEVRLCALRDDIYGITTDKQFEYEREII